MIIIIPRENSPFDARAWEEIIARLCAVIKRRNELGLARGGNKPLGQHGSPATNQRPARRSAANSSLAFLTSLIH